MKKDRKRAMSIAFRPETLKILDSRKLDRDSRSQILEDDLRILWVLLEQGKEGLFDIFTQDEFRVLALCGNGVRLTPQTLPYWISGGIAAELELTNFHDVAVEEDIDPLRLLHKINSLEQLHNLALADILTKLRISKVKGEALFDRLLPLFLSGPKD